MVQSWCAEKAEDLPDVEYIMPDGCCSCHSLTVRQHEEIQLISVHPVFLAFFRIQTVDAVEFILGKLFAFFSCALKGYVTVHMIWIDNFCCPPRSKRSLERSFEKIHLQYLCTTFPYLEEFLFQFCTTVFSSTDAYSFWLIGLWRYFEPQSWQTTINNDVILFHQLIRLGDK